ncbi:MAG: DUF192 domain-containing protein [Candidatus Micrarchaeia archaeon]
MSNTKRKGRKGILSRIFGTGNYETRTIYFKSTAIKVFIADSFTKKMFGLMHWERLGAREGMLFPLNSAAEAGIWMLGMKFSIDIIWLDAKGKVIDMVAGAKPCNIFTCKVYYPVGKPSYVLEIGAGVSRKLGLKPGAKVNLGK